jgi:hypothetical protein
MESKNHPDSENRLNFEIELFKLKLDLVHGMSLSDTSALDVEIENHWLNSIYGNFEHLVKDAKKIKVYEFIGKPVFTKVEELSATEISEVLQQLRSTMREKGVVLNCKCEYECKQIYKFIVEELFNQEIDDISIEGIVHHFNYEEFYPNHDYDLRRYTEEFVNNLLSQKWNPKIDVHSFNKTVSYRDKGYNNREISSIILAFQESRSFQLEDFEIKELSFDIEKGEGKVIGYMAYHAYILKFDCQLYQGAFDLSFTYAVGYWYLSGFQLPGFGN